MSSKKNIIITKTLNYSYWKNNVINFSNYSTFNFQMSLIKNIVLFFFYTHYSNSILNIKKRVYRLYLSQLWINSIESSVIISISIYAKQKKKRNYQLYDNYVRLKYLYLLI